jgi:3,4-dihydroxy-2-butanone 4-phosphate synthase
MTHPEGSNIDLMKLAGLQPKQYFANYGTPDGTMAKLIIILKCLKEHDLIVSSL